MRPIIRLVVLSLSSLAGCGPQAPAHEVVITSDCNGEERTSVFRFPDTDFETDCSGGLLSGECDRNHATGERVSGDLVVERLWLTGTERFGPGRYELWFAHPEGDFAPEPWDWRSIECYWYRNDEEPRYDQIGERHDCSFTDRGCWAELDYAD